MRSFSFLLLSLLFLTACTGQSESVNPELKRLKSYKYSIDSMIAKGTLFLYVKVPGKNELMPIRNGGKFPELIEATYNVFKNTDGKVLYIAEFPFSPKDDWYIAYKNYFTKNGELAVFQRQNNFFNSECVKGAAMENLIKYYTPDFKVVDSTYTLTDTNKKELEKAKCKFPYNFPYKVEKSLSEYLEVRGIKQL